MYLLDSTLQRLDEVFDRISKRGANDSALATMLLAPALGILLIFGAFPLVYAGYLSLFRGQVFIGSGHYADALHSESFWDSLFVTCYYAAGTVPTTIVVSFLIANLLFRVTRFRGAFRTLYFLPYVTSVVASAMIWRVLFEPTTGPANLFLGLFGLDPQTWLLEPRGLLHILTQGYLPVDLGPSLALCCVMLFEIWHSSGFMIVVFLAGLSAIPKELEDAARIDGATAIQVARNVTLPLLSPTLFFLTIVSVIRSFQAFSSFYALTGNGRGPLDTTQNLTVYIYANFYEYGRLGYGSAVAGLLCVAIVGLTTIQWRFLSPRVYYQ